MLFRSVYLVGKEMNNLKDQLIKDGYPQADIHSYDADQLEQLTSELKAVLTADDAVLMKASHGIHLEKVLAELASANEK